MKKNLFLLSLSIAQIIVFADQVQAQKTYTIQDYSGTWRWVNGNNKDTFLLVFIHDPTRLDSELTKHLNPELFNNTLQGYHRYVEKALLVESSLSAVNGSRNKRPTVNGGLNNNALTIVFQDFTRNTTLQGSFTIVQDSPKFAIWDVASLPQERFNFDGLGYREYPPGQTMPNRIVLEKIK